MAEYKALSQNTYKFVSERVFNAVGNISLPTAPMFGKAKVIIDNQILYNSISVFGENINSNDHDLITDSDSGSQTGIPRTYVAYVVHGMEAPGRCNAEGKAYFGLKNSSYSLVRRYSYSQTTATAPSSLNEMLIPGGKAKIIKYAFAEGGINTEEFSFDKTVVAAAIGYKYSSAYSYTYQYAYLSVAKTSDDIILGIEIEYPKYDVTLSNIVTGLQYSSDDGVTFTDVTEGLALSQIEHVVFRNTGEADIDIGTTERGSEIGTITAGSDFVAIPEADGTWYIA